MDQDRAFILLARYVAGEATAEEMEELEWAFLAFPELRRMAEILPELSQSPPKGISAEEEQRLMEDGLHKITCHKEKADVVDANIAPPVAVRRVAMMRWMAAACVLLLVVALCFVKETRHSAGDEAAALSAKARAPATLEAGRGAKRYMRLPDGSQLWLNAGSKVVFAQGFSRSKRELQLEGEAFFDVKHDAQHPFLIHAGHLDVRVLGTTLNVKAYPGDSLVETTLIDGKVEVSIAGDPQSSMLLHPNEKVIIPSSSVAFVRKPVVPDQTDGTISETSWVENKLVFRQETLAGLAVRLERWYNIKIVFYGDRYQQDTISGTFPNVPIADVMHALQLTAGFHYSIAKDTVKIW